MNTITSTLITEDVASLTSRTGAYLVSEASGYRSREQVTIAAGLNLVAGTVLGKITASGKYVLHDAGAADGSQNACAILFEGAKAASADVRRVITARDTEVKAAFLTFKSGISGTNKTAALAALATLGIVTR